MAVNPERHPRNHTDRVKTILDRDHHNLRTFLSDHRLNKPITPVCDCCDLIRFLHIEDPQCAQQDAYTEGIRRYFVKSNEVLLIPSWTYELLEFIRRLVVDNIGTFGGDLGYQAFIGKYPDAERFMTYWKSNRFEDATKLQSQGHMWAQIVSFTRDDRVEKLLGNTIRRFNVLVANNKFAPLDKYVDIEKFEHVDTLTFDVVMSHLNSSRPGSGNFKKNQIDAHSLAIIYQANLCSDDSFFTAVTSAQLPLQAFNSAMELASQNQSGAYSTARSSVCNWMYDLAVAHAGGSISEYLERGIDLNREISTLVMRSYQRTKDKYRTVPYPTEATIENAKEEGQLEHLLNLYFDYYREPLFRPIEKSGSFDSHDRGDLLSAEETAEALEPKKFQESMRQARRQVQKESERMIAASKRFINPGNAQVVGGKKLSTLLSDLERDFEKQVY